MFKYYRPAVMFDHFDRKHIRELDSTKRMLYNYLKYKEEALEFKHLNYFKNYIESVYGIKLRA
jgi:hypothetical protein